MLSRIVTYHHERTSAVPNPLAGGQLATRSDFGSDMRYTQKPPQTWDPEAMPTQDTNMSDQIFPPMNLSRGELEQAICRIDKSGFQPHHQSHTYAVRHNDKLYPPIPIVAFAIEAREGRPIATGVIRGGKNTPAFKILRREGFEIIRRDKA